jgi:hypothetical protein
MIWLVNGRSDRRAKGKRLTADGLRLTANGVWLTVNGVRLKAYGPRRMVRNAGSNL